MSGAPHDMTFNEEASRMQPVGQQHDYTMIKPIFYREDLNNTSRFINKNKNKLQPLKVEQSVAPIWTLEQTSFVEEFDNYDLYQNRVLNQSKFRTVIQNTSFEHSKGINFTSNKSSEAKHQMDSRMRKKLEYFEKVLGGKLDCLQ